MCMHGCECDFVSGHVWYVRAHMCMYINNIYVCVCIVYVCFTVRFFTVSGVQSDYVYDQSNTLCMIIQFR